MTFSVVFVDHLVVVVRQIVTRKTRSIRTIEWKSCKNINPNDPNGGNGESRQILVSFYAVREGVNASNEPVHKEKFCVPVSGTQNFSKVIRKT